MPGRLIRPPKRFQQPQGRVPLARGNQLAAKVIVHFPLRDASPGLSGEIVTVGSGATFSSGIKGRSVKGSGAAAVASVPLNLSAYAQISVSCWFNWPAYGVADKLLMEFTANFNAASGGFIFDPDPASAVFQIGASTGTPNLPNVVSIVRPSAAVWHRLTACFDITNAQVTRAVYVDGIAQALTVVSSNAGGATAFANDTLYLLSRGNTSLQGAGYLQDLTIYRGVLNADEARADYENPWQIFAPLAVAPFVPDPMPSSCVYCGDEADSLYEPEDTSAFEFYADNTANQEMSAAVPPLLPDSFEWEDPNETESALYPDYWAQAPPIPNLPAETGGQNTVEDAHDQPEDQDEDFGFVDAPFEIVAAADQIYPECADAQPADDDEDFGFALDGIAPPDQIYVEDASGQPDEPEDAEGFADAPFEVPAVPDQPQPECADGQPDEQDEPEGFSDSPLAEDAPMLAIESAEQAEPDEEVEGFSDAPQADPVDTLSLIPPECADNQIDTPDDEAFDFFDAPRPDDVAPVAVFPDPSQVLLGVHYGPNGNDFVGTFVCPTSGSGVYLRRR